MNVLFLRVGIFSNLNTYLLNAINHEYHVVENIDAGDVIRRKTIQFSSWYNIFYTIIHSKKNWRQTHSKNSYAFTQMTNYCNRSVRERTDYDIILQTQCKFGITENPYSKPYYIYTDLTQKITDRVWPKWELKASQHEIKKWYNLEINAFERATKIFTFNNYVKNSFVEDYHIDADKVIVVGSGINNDDWLEPSLEKKLDHCPTLFFLTTEFERQGGPAIIEAFKRVKKKIKDIRLIIGGKCPENLPKGIENISRLDRQTIEKYFDQTTIYLLPGKLGGLQSVLEAMSKKCVCIVGESNFLLFDLIRDNITGCVIKTNDVEQLSDKIIHLCENEELMKNIANRAYRYVSENHTWDKIVKKMSVHFEIDKV